MIKMKENKCPQCGSTNAAKILYGMPKFTSDLKKKLDNHKIKLGGCSIHEGSKDWFCNECAFEWGGRTANVLKKHVQEIFERELEKEKKMDEEAIKRGKIKAKVNKHG